MNVRDVPVGFDKDTKPFKPLEQLMAVFPSQSRKFLPVDWQTLMLVKDSPIIDFYPLDFSIDLNGKRQAWQGVALLPFVDEKRLHRTLDKVYSTLTNEERKRNKCGHDRLYIHSENLCYDYLKELYVPGANEVTKKKPLEMPTMLSGGMGGLIWPDDDDEIKPVGEQINAPLPNCEEILNNQVVCVKYKDLEYDGDYLFKAKLLENLTMPDATLRPRDYDQSMSFRPRYQDQMSSYRPRYQDQMSSYRPRHQDQMSSYRPRYQDQMSSYRPRYQDQMTSYRPRYYDQRTPSQPRYYDPTTPFRPNLGFAQRPQYQRDSVPAQRFIRHSIGPQQSNHRGMQ